MPSTLTNYSTNIDTTFPVPGADNDTQGFRDNFIAIKNSLETASTEISAVQVIQSSLVTHAPAEPVSSVGVPGDLNGQMYATSSTVYICYSDYVGTTTNIWAKISTVGGSW